MHVSPKSPKSKEGGIETSWTTRLKSGVIAMRFRVLAPIFRGCPISRGQGGVSVFADFVGRMWQRFTLIE
jgi:hypothetical protein